MECASPSSHYKTKKILKSKADTDSTREDLAAHSPLWHRTPEATQGWKSVRFAILAGKSRKQIQTSLDAEKRAIKSNTVGFKSLRRASPSLRRQRGDLWEMGSHSGHKQGPTVSHSAFVCLSFSRPFCGKHEDSFPWSCVHI